MKTADQVKQDFIVQGITIAKWAEEHGYNLFTVYRVLDGSLKGRYGISHRIAVDLGLKEAPTETERAQPPRQKRRMA